MTDDILLPTLGVVALLLLCFDVLITVCHPLRTAVVAHIRELERYAIPDGLDSANGDMRRATLDELHVRILKYLLYGPARA